jgi:hypothetical protein
MADVAPSFAPATRNPSFNAVSINQTGVNATGTLVGDWITPLDGVLLIGYCINYLEGGGTMSQAIVTTEVLIDGDLVNVYTICGTAGAAQSMTVTATSSVLLPFGVTGPYPLCGVTKARARAVVTGTGGGTDNIRVSFFGLRRDS